MPDSRRNFLAMAAIVPVAIFAAGSARAVDAACYNPSALPLSQKNRRRSIGFEETSTNPKERCELCAFYTATKGDCGTCQMLSGGPVNAKGLCRSFAQKSG